MRLNLQDRNKFVIIIDIFLLSITFYLVIAAGLHGSDVGRARYDVLSSLTNNFDFNIPEGTGIKGVDGRDYSWFGIGSVLLNLPFYLIDKHIVLIPLVNIITSAATNCLLFIFSHSLGYSKRSSVMVSLIYGFATIACYYAKDHGDHSIETFFVLLAVYSMYRHTITRKVSFSLCSAFSIGFAVLTRPNALIAIPAIFVLILLKYLSEGCSRENLKLLALNLCTFIIGLIPFAILFMWYDYYRFGSVMETGHHIMAMQLGLDYFTGTGFFTGIAGLLVSPGKGFFYYSPPALLFIITIRSFFKTNPEITLCFVTLICSYFFFYAKNIYWHGDWAWGPRYVVATLPYFLIPTVSILNNPSKIIRGCIISILAISILIQLLAISISPLRYFIDLQFREGVKFTIVSGKGVPSINEPSVSTYFDWHKSPILYHLKFFRESAVNEYNYKYIDVENNMAKHNYILSEPFMNVYDFGWLYSYYIHDSSKYIFTAILLLFITAYCAKNLYSHTFK